MIWNENISEWTILHQNQLFASTCLSTQASQRYTQILWILSFITRHQEGNLHTLLRHHSTRLSPVENPYKCSITAKICNKSSIITVIPLAFVRIDMGLFRFLDLDYLTDKMIESSVPRIFHGQTQHSLSARDKIRKTETMYRRQKIDQTGILVSAKSAASTTSSPARRSAIRLIISYIFAGMIKSFSSSTDTAG